MKKTLIYSFILSTFFAMGSLYAIKNEENSTNSIKDEEENGEDQNIIDHLVPNTNQNNAINPKKRKREEKKENKKLLKKRKLSRLEMEQELNYPEPITWEELLKSLEKKTSTYVNFIKNEITDEKEKEDFLNAFKKIYKKNTTLLQNSKTAIILAKYFKKKYRTNIDNNMILIDIFHKITSKSKEITFSMPDVLNKFIKASVTKEKINFIKKTIDRLEKENKCPTLLFSVFNYILDNKNISDENVQTYVNDYEKTNSTIKNNKKNIMLINQNSKDEISFLEFFNNSINDENKKYFLLLSTKNQQIIKSTLKNISNDKKNFLLANIKKFHKNFPYIFKTNYKKNNYRSRQHPIDSMCRHFNINSFLSMSDDQLKNFSNEYVNIFKEKLGKKWKEAICLCADLSFDQISLFCNLLSAIENPSSIIQNNLIHFASNIIGIEPPSSSVKKQFKDVFPDISEKTLNNIQIVILYNATFTCLENKNYPDNFKEIKRFLCSIFNFLNEDNIEKTHEYEMIDTIYSIILEFVNNSKIKNSKIRLYLTHIIIEIERFNLIMGNSQSLKTFYVLLKSKINTLFSSFQKTDDQNNLSTEIKINTNIKILDNINNSIHTIHNFFYKYNNMINLEDNLQKIFKGFLPNIPEHIILKIPSQVFLYMRINDENIRASLDSIFRTLNTLFRNPNQPNLTEAERIEIKTILKYFTDYIKQYYDQLDEMKFCEECLEKGIQAKDDQIYTQLQEIRSSLNRIYARLRGTHINYEERQSVHSDASHKAADDMIQDLWKKLPLDNYKYNANKFLPYCNEDGTTNEQKTKTLNDIGIELILKSVILDIDLDKHLFFLHEILNTPKDILNYIINYDENNSDHENAILLNSSYDEYKMSEVFHAYFTDYKYKFDNNPEISEHDKNISFRELFNKACIHLQKECRFHEYGPVFSIEEIREYENAFLRYRAKKLLLSIAQNAARKINEFSQPKRGQYSQGLFALLLRVILNIHATTPNKNDLKDKFLTLRNNLAYASLEYSLDLSACTFGQTYNIIEQFLNMIHVNDVISINASNFNQIFIALAQPEVERINASTGTVEDKLDQLKANIILSLSDPSKYAQDFWHNINDPLKQIDEFVDGLREHFEDDDQIIIEEENQ
ncbi:MAG: hypothetical protein Q8L85_07325 [Alphaproteobacteria bacterium]|nr:hypothetical protein [Alphaproteobacteria bacterium]